MFNEQTQGTPATEQSGEATTQTTTPSSSFDTLLSEIRNERGEQKYRNVEDGLNALKHSQEYIYKTQTEKRQMEEELIALRERAARVEALEDTIAKLTQRTDDSAQQKPQLDEESIAKMVDSRIHDRQVAQVNEANKRAVVAELTAKFGDKASEVFYSKAQQMGLTAKEVEELSARSPKAVLTMFGISSDAAHKQASTSPAKSQFNSEHFQSQPGSFIGSETERIPLGGGQHHLTRILDNSRKMVDELREQGMSVNDLTNPANYMRYIKNQKR